MNVRFSPVVCLVVAGLAILSAAATAPAQDVDPQPQPWVIGGPLHRWSFAADCAGWKAAHDCQLSSQAGAMHIVATGADPYLIAKLPKAVPGPMIVRLRLRSTMKGRGQMFWTTDQQPHVGEDQSRFFDITHDGQWHEYQVPLETQGTVQRLRFDPGTGPGEADVAWIELQDAYPYPLVIERMTTTSGEIRLALRNRGRRSLTVTVAGKTFELPS